MPAHLRSPDRRLVRPLAALVIAFGVALIAIAGMSGQAPDEDTPELVQPANDVSTAPTVLGSTVERSTTLPSAPPAAATGFTTTTGEGSSSTGGGGGGGPAPTTQGTTSPTLGPPVSITNPGTRPTTTSTTEDPTTTTSETSVTAN